MAEFSSAKTSNGFTLKLTLSETSTSVTSNTSTVRYTLVLTSGGYDFSGYPIGYSVSLAGNVVAFADRYNVAYSSLGKNSSLTLATGTTTIKHNEDGSKIMSVAFSIDMATVSYTPGPISVTGKTMTLTMIPRASTISATNANIGSTSKITVIRKSTSYTHSIGYSFPKIDDATAASGFIDADGNPVSSEVKFTATSIDFKIPAKDFYPRIWNAASGKCTLICTTYSGGTKIGSAQTCTFTATASKAENAPDVTATVVDGNDFTKNLTGNENKLILYHSVAKCAIGALPKNSAKIDSVTVNGVSLENGGTKEITDFTSGDFVFSATDTRGYTTNVTVKKEIIEYIPLTCTATAETVSMDGEKKTVKIKASGNYFGESFGSKDNTLKIIYKTHGPDKDSYEDNAVKVDNENIDTTKPGSWSAEITLAGIPYDQSLYVMIMAEDVFGEKYSASAEVQIMPTVPVFDWGKNDFSFHVPIYVKGKSLEDGTWTPVVNHAASYVKQIGWYSKVRNVVTIGFDIQANMGGSSSTSNPFQITGLPFTPNCRAGGGGVATNVYLAANGAFEGWWIPDASDVIEARATVTKSSAGNISTGTVMEPAANTSGVSCVGTITYTTDEDD